MRHHRNKITDTRSPLFFVFDTRNSISATGVSVEFSVYNDTTSCAKQHYWVYARRTRACIPGVTIFFRFPYGGLCMISGLESWELGFGLESSSGNGKVDA